MSIKKQVSEIKLVIMPRTSHWFYRLSPDEQAKELESTAREIMDFFRDHRSMDIHGIHVEKAHTMVCEYCEHNYGDNFNGIYDCCDKAIEEVASALGL